MRAGFLDSFRKGETIISVNDVVQMISGWPKMVVDWIDKWEWVNVCWFDRYHRLHEACVQGRMLVKVAEKAEEK